MDQKYTSKINVIGLGYIGLPTASVLATRGYQVLGVDIAKEVVETINKGDIHIVEPDLDVLVRSAVNSGNLTASLTPTEADIFIIAVPTPFLDKKTHKEIDLSYIESATRSISQYLKVGDLVILESTSQVGTTEFIQTIIQQERPDLNEIYIAHCPERVLPGHILRELVENDRIVGGIDEISAEKAKEFYATFCNGEILTTDSRTAELVKLAENTFRDVNIAYANELSMICDRLDINVWEMIKFANRHPRVNILNPGPGVGGHCIAVDPWFIVSSAPEQARLIRTAREVNDSKPNWVVEKVVNCLEGIDQPTIGCLGMTFKANVDDIRESPALHIINRLHDLKLGKVLVCDPYIKKHPVFTLSSLEDVLTRSDVLVLLVDHSEFKSMDPSLLEGKIIVDTRGILG